MADIVAQSADGQFHSFPEGTDPSVIDKVMKQYAVEHAPKVEPSSLVDAARSIPGGLAKGVAAVAGLPGTLERLADIPARYVAGAFGGNSDPNLGHYSTPSPQTVENIISKPTGGFYQPQTTAGRYAETIASFAPAAFSPGSVAARASRVIAPAVGSETAGELTAGTPVEGAARFIGAVAGGGIPSIARAGGRVAAGVANRASESAFGTPLRDPTTAAESALKDAVARDGGQAAVTPSIASWEKTGASAPSLIDVAGNNVRRTVRAAAGSPDGDAGNVAQSYADKIAANLQDRSSGLARGLTPGEPRPANIVREDLVNTRSDLAKEQYAQPYSEPASVTKEMVSALQGPEGRGAIAQAYATARAQRDAQAMAELSDLRKVAAEQGGGTNIVTGQRQTLDQALSELSAGSLDRVRIAMRETAANLAKNDRRGMASGYYGRVNDIDTALDQTPGLADARKTYRDYSNRIAGIDLGSQAATMPPNEYAWQLADLASKTPRYATQAAGVGYRQAIVNGIERPAEGSTGFLNRVASSEAQTQNLASTFGKPAAEKFQAGVGNEVDRLRNARFINPNTGSQTEPRLAERALVDLVTGGKVGVVTRVIDAARRGTVLTAREKAELVRLGTSEADVKRLISSLPATADPVEIFKRAALSGVLSTSQRRTPEQTQ